MIFGRDELAKLFLPEELVDFSQITDDSCTASAILIIMHKATCFNVTERHLAKSILNEVWLPWSKGSYADWNQDKSEKCFRLFDDLLIALDKGQRSFSVATVRSRLNELKENNFNIVNTKLLDNITNGVRKGSGRQLRDSDVKKLRPIGEGGFGKVWQISCLRL